MLSAVVDLLLAALTVLAVLVLGAVAVAAAIGVPYAVGKLIYDRAAVDDLSNPAVLGFGAAFFAVLIGLFALGVVLLWMG